MIVFLKKANKEIEQKKANGTLTMDDLNKLMQGSLALFDVKEQAEMKAMFDKALKDSGVEVPEQKKVIPEKVSILPKRWEC